MRIGHNAPVMDISIANFPYNHTNLDLLLNKDSDKSPPLNKLHLNGTVPRRFLADRAQELAVFLKRCRCFQNAKTKRQEREFEHLLFLVSFAPCRIAEMMEPIGIQNNILLKERVIDRPLGIINLPCLFLLLFKIAIIHNLNGIAFSPVGTRDNFGLIYFYRFSRHTCYMNLLDSS
jgi:hypothetical protein